MPIPKSSTPSFLDTARAIYGDAFDHKKKRALAGSMAEWAELGEDEQSFAVAHLLYLNLQGHVATQRLLVQVRDLLDELNEAFTGAIEAGLADPEEPGEEPQDEEDDDGDLDPDDDTESVTPPAPDVVDATAIGPDGRVPS